MKVHFQWMITLLMGVHGVIAFAPSYSRIVTYQTASSVSSTSLFMAAEKKRRRRKVSVPSSTESGLEQNSSDEKTPTLEELKALANFTPSKKKEGVPVPTTSSSSASIPGVDPSPLADESENLIQELPDIKDVLKNKELKRLEEEEKSKKARPRISRSDKKAMRDLLEQEPFADADASYFEEEEYGTVSALLGEGAKPFLGIPPGPLQVGHFIGALGIVLMAFVEYPGFPLTNLPTPLRDCLQGGLGTIYLCNAVLAVLAAFAASERGQNPGLWAVKTFSVGGLAFDQLTQLPKKKK